MRVPAVRVRFRFVYAVICIACCSTCPGLSLAQDVPDGVDGTFRITPATLLLQGDASSIVRLSYHRFEASGPGKATEYTRRAITILDENGRGYGQFVVGYDALRKIKRIEGSIRNADGKIVRKLKKSEIADLSAVSDFSLYEDNRVRVAELYHDAYPYTVEFSVEVEYDGLISWPTWYPQENGLPVEHAQFEVSAPSGMIIRHAVRGMDLEPEEIASGGKKTLRWTATMLPRRIMEPGGPSWAEQTPAVYTSSAAFEIDGSRGDMSTWSSLAQWYYGLGAGRDRLPPEAVERVRHIVDAAENDLEKVRLLYEYLQSTTRYVSVQLGIGGWQPFDAEYVFRRGYGDCKALVNYMLALLKEAGITAYPALIRSGYGAPEVLTSFSSNQFNHVVLAVPLEGDSLWLECTSQTIPFGRIGGANEDRFALVVRPDGGELVRTPRSTAAENAQIRRGHIVLHEDGNATADIRTEYSGSQQDHIRNTLAHAPARNRDQWLRESIRVPAFEVLSASFESIDHRKPVVEIPFTLQMNRYASRTGERLFLRPNLMEHWVGAPQVMETRTQPVVYAFAFADADTLTFELPTGYRIEAAFPDVNLETSFGRYASSVRRRPDGLLEFTRVLEIRERKIPTEEYPAYREFLVEVARADNGQIVLVKDKS